MEKFDAGSEAELLADLRKVVSLTVNNKAVRFPKSRLKGQLQNLQLAVTVAEHLAEAVGFHANIRPLNDPKNLSDNRLVRTWETEDGEEVGRSVGHWLLGQRADSVTQALKSITKKKKASATA
jgi:hypothetical protein